MSGTDQQATPHAGSPPADPPSGGNGEKPGKVYTEEEVQRRFQGQGKVIEELRAKLTAYEQQQAEAERKRLEEAGQYKTLAEQERAAHAATQKELEELRKREEKRLAALKESNKQRIHALPEEIRALVPQGLDPDELAEHLGKVEAHVSQGRAMVHGGAGRPQQPQTPADSDKERTDRLRAALLGTGKKR
jgi:chromosome segregation ATPase